MKTLKKPRTPRGQRPQHDPLTYVYPRTLEEAFGPGEGGPVVPMADPKNPKGLPEMDWFDRSLLVIIPLVLVVVMAILMIAAVLS
jgi:hypothetical protein